jgi:hypothetical protein
MAQASTLSPIDPQYTDHRDLEERRRQTREWLQQRERELGLVSDAPSVAPENGGATDAPLVPRTAR